MNDPDSESECPTAFDDPAIIELLALIVVLLLPPIKESSPSYNLLYSPNKALYMPPK